MSLADRPVYAGPQGGSNLFSLEVRRELILDVWPSLSSARLLFPLATPYVNLVNFFTFMISHVVLLLMKAFYN